ncbi:MAG: nucleotide exchange factor GrpE [Candidatus Altiarchaeota archaeon]
MKSDKLQDKGAEKEQDPGIGGDNIENPLDAEKSKTEEYKRLLQRLQADFENHLKRSEAQRAELVRSANKDLIIRLLEVVDTMDAALAVECKDGDEKRMLDGFKKVGAKMSSVLSAEGLEDVDTTGMFDHGIHEAVDVVEDGCRPDGSIVDVVQKGYKLNGTLIRTSKVIVVKNRGDANG